MPGSSERINYSLRPAKQIERKMLLEAFGRLAPFGSLQAYRYVGFGSFYFADFAMLHKNLGVTNLVSIEGDTSIKRTRFLKNRPFKCIDINFGMSQQELPKLRWDNIRTILWLDYDFALDDSVLADVEFFSQHACPGSLLLVTLDLEPNSELKLYPNLENSSVLNRYRRILGEDRIPRATKEADFDGWRRASVFRKIINEEIKNALTERNLSRPSGTEFRYQQLFNFHYKDTARMLTVGGILYDEGSETVFRNCGFDKLHPIYKPSEEPLLIEVPKLTFREIRLLNAQLPNRTGKPLKSSFIPEEQIRMYEKIYRWFPTFTEADI